MSECNAQIRDAEGMPPLAAAVADFEKVDVTSGASATPLERV